MNEARRVLLESLLVAILALILALGANALNPDGLTLKRNYFEVEVMQVAAEPSDASRASDPGGAGGGSEPLEPADAGGQDEPPDSGGQDDPVEPGELTAEEQDVAERLAAIGIRVITHAEVEALFNDPIYQDGAYTFVDARNDEHFVDGHIPGAFQLDHYHLERYIDEVRNAAIASLEVVVYCYGQDCTDSEIAAKHLINYGIDRSTIRVYVGGIQAWCKSGNQVERGQRGSGELGACDS